MCLKIKSVAFLPALLLTCNIAQAGLFGLGKDKQEYLHARETFAQGRYEQAVQELSQYIYKTKNIKRREARAYRLLGLSYEQLNRPDKALEAYSEALEFHQKNVPLLVTAAALYQRTGLTDHAIDLYDRALILDPENTDALAGQAENYMSMGFYSKARQYYEKFFLLRPDAPSIHRARYAQAFLKQRDYQNAFIHISMAKTEDPHNASYWLLSARAWRGLGNIDEAMADLNTALALTPERIDLQAVKALWLYDQHDYLASTQAAQQLLKSQPHHELALFILYLNQHKRGLSGAAQRSLQQITQQNSGSFIYRAAEKLLQGY